MYKKTSRAYIVNKFLHHKTAGGEEALGISVYCALKYYDDFEQALIAAVNHDGDSDSTGANWLIIAYRSSEIRIFLQVIREPDIIEW